MFYPLRWFFWGHRNILYVHLLPTYYRSYKFSIKIGCFLGKDLKDLGQDIYDICQITFLKIWLNSGCIVGIWHNSYNYSKTVNLIKINQEIVGKTISLNMEDL